MPLCLNRQQKKLSIGLGSGETTQLVFIKKIYLSTSLDSSYWVEENKFWPIFIQLNFDTFLVILKYNTKSQGKYLLNFKMT